MRRWDESAALRAENAALRTENADLRRRPTGLSLAA
jgi:hypothetical protein